jgi:hypothetical protein
MTRNPWLDIPLGDYEAHMALPAVGQSQLRLLEPGMHLRSHEELQQRATQAGFTPEDSRTILSPGGKQFTVETFRIRLNTPVDPGAV